MKFRSLAAAAAAVSLAVTPAIAQSNFDRAVAPVSSESELGDDRDASGVILAILAAGAIIAGIVIAAGSDEDTTPISQ